MRGERGSSARAQQEQPPAGALGPLDGAGAVPADLIADTVGALQARRDGDDRDALRGTIGPLARFARAEPRVDAVDGRLAHAGGRRR